MRTICVALAGLALSVLSACSDGGGERTTLTVAIVNNGDMVRLREFSREFEKDNPAIRLKWVVLEENILRQRVTTDVAIRGGQYDIVMIGAYEVPVWAGRNWLAPLDDLGDAYQAADLIAPVRDVVSDRGVQYAAPFNGESSITMYRTDLFRQVGLAMPEAPTWEFLIDAASKLHRPKEGVYGLCLRGMAGWGANMVVITAMANAYGARLFDEQWRPQFDTPEWRRAATTYVGAMRAYGPPGASSNSFNENLALFSQGKCAIWVDATVAAPFLSDPKSSTVAPDTGFAGPPDEGLGRSSSWLWTWALAIPSSSKKSDAAKAFIRWAAGPAYQQLVSRRLGPLAVPPGTRKSLYANPDYRKVAPFADITLKAISAANPRSPTVKPVPYVGVQYAAIPEFQGIGTEVGQQFAAAVAGRISAEDALAEAQAATRRHMAAAGYYK
ncbi:ABC transporter substrate-binding protein [Sphingomonas sp.]|uniref:ABC transporter substrate-binding protein n=1 Tax=Sphingomonas sp. TaxID=28214 RepID=UPI002DD63E09|nr:sugar ABC transporter substrate-binding protein [Sphingomonas sp.]